MAIAKDVQGNGPGGEPGRAETLSEQGLPNFGVAGEDGAVDGNGEFLHVEDAWELDSGE